MHDAVITLCSCGVIRSIHVVDINLLFSVEPSKMRTMILKEVIEIVNEKSYMSIASSFGFFWKLIFWTSFTAQNASAIRTKMKTAPECDKKENEGGSIFDDNDGDGEIYRNR